MTQNVFDSNARDGVTVIGEQAGLTSASIRNEITRNSFSNNVGRAIDLGELNSLTGGGLDPLDGDYDLTGVWANAGIDRPVVVSLDVLNDNSIDLDFNISPAFGNPKIEVYLAGSSDTSPLPGVTFAEGTTYFTTFEFDGSAYVRTHSSGASITAADRVVLLAIDADGNTSEFSNAVDVNIVPVAVEDNFTVRENEAFTATQGVDDLLGNDCLLYTSPSPRDATLSRMPSSA